MKITSFFRRIGKAVGGFFADVRDRIREYPFRIKKGFAVYVLLLLLTVFATQALISPLTAILFTFMMILPFVSLAYLYIVTQTVKVKTEISECEVEKNSPVSYSLSLYNSSFIPLNQLEARITSPRNDGIRSEESRTLLSLVPFGNYTISSQISFPYRGSYELGVSDIVCSDLFGMFSYSIRMNDFESIFVLPKRLTAPVSEMNDQSEPDSDVITRRNGTDNTEQNDIRQYRSGDSLRSVHWKLSSKTQELMVRQYTQDKENRVFILCDTADRYDLKSGEFLPDVNEFSVDGVVEAAIALTVMKLSQGGKVTLVWFDRREDNGIAVRDLESMYDFEQIYHFFASSPISDTGMTVRDLALSVEIPDGSSVICISPAADMKLAVALTGGKSDGGSGGEAQAFCDLYCVIPYEKAASGYSDKFRDEVDAALGEIRRGGIKVFDARF